MEFLQFLEPWMIPIVIMICVTLIVAISVIGSIIKASMKKKNSSLSDNQEFLEALRDFKENMDRRVSNLERIAASEEPSTQKLNKHEPKKQSAIELELDEETRSSKNSKESSSKLRNMLNH
jgi:hypothetical protein